MPQTTTIDTGRLTAAGHDVHRDRAAASLSVSTNGMSATRLYAMGGEVGKRIGPYRLTQEIGRGGMGVVYLAERADGAFEHEVAIKLLATPSTPSALPRFRREQQVLASLNHPNIARLYNGGMTNDGWPYLVMEYVRGTPLLKFCRQRALGIDARLDLVAQIAAGLQHAHDRGVIHRDIKPSNILVTDDGQIKLLDFGIAKALRPDAKSDLTRTGQGVFSTPYAAPEQLKDGPISVETDVYQLGILLYQLLVGRPPFERQSSLYEFARLVCERMPERPSVVSRRIASEEAGEASGLLARLRLRRPCTALSRDLDAVAMKSLHKQPARRYASMGALIADLHAYRAGRPVHARGPSVAYRAALYARRHAFSVALAAGFAALTIVNVLTLATHADRLRETRAQAMLADSDRAGRSDATIEALEAAFHGTSGSTFAEAVYAR